MNLIPVLSLVLLAIYVAHAGYTPSEVKEMQHLKTMLRTYITSKDGPSNEERLRIGKIIDQDNLEGLRKEAALLKQKTLEAEGKKKFTANLVDTESLDYERNYLQDFADTCYLLKNNFKTIQACMQNALDASAQKSTELALGKALIMFKLTMNLCIAERGETTVAARTCAKDIFDWSDLVDQPLFKDVISATAGQALNLVRNKPDEVISFLSNGGLVNEIYVKGAKYTSMVNEWVKAYL